MMHKDNDFYFDIPEKVDTHINIDKVFSNIKTLNKQIKQNKTIISLTDIQSMILSLWFGKLTEKQFIIKYNNNIYNYGDFNTQYITFLNKIAKYVTSQKFDWTTYYFNGDWGKNYIFVYGWKKQDDKELITKYIKTYNKTKAKFDKQNNTNALKEKIKKLRNELKKKERNK
jgi:hypothetical protein